MFKMLTFCERCADVPYTWREFHQKACCVWWCHTKRLGTNQQKILKIASSSEYQVNSWFHHKIFRFHFKLRQVAAVASRWWSSSSLILNVSSSLSLSDVQAAHCCYLTSFCIKPISFHFTLKSLLTRLLYLHNYFVIYKNNEIPSATFNDADTHWNKNRGKIIIIPCLIPANKKTC